MLQTFRTFTIDIDSGDEITQVNIPFDVALLVRVEETLQKLAEPGWNWFRLKRSDKSILRVYEEFCRPFMPAKFDFAKVQPTFCALFFSRVRAELRRSINECIDFMNSTGTPHEPTEERTAETAYPSAPAQTSSSASSPSISPTAKH